MSRKRSFYVVAISVLALLIMGAAPRYLESLAIGGGHDSTPDGGLDIESDGDVFSDGDASFEGKVSTGEFSGSLGQLAARSGASGESALDLYNDSVYYGGRLWFDGTDNSLNLGTRSGAAEAITALAVPEGSNDVLVAGSLFVGNGSVLETLRFAGPNATFRRLEYYTGSPETSANRRWMFGASEHSEAGQYGGSAFKITAWDNSGNYIDNILFIEREPSSPVVVSKGFRATGALTSQSGDVTSGTDGGNRGVVTLWDGSGGSAPGCVRLASPNGTLWYLFVEDDGTVKVSSTLPTSNGSGNVVGGQF